MATPDAHIRDWLKGLGVLIAVAMSRDEANARVNALAPHLAREFPPGAFTEESMRVVARAYRFFPNFAELCDALDPWWKHQRAAQEYLALPPARRESTEPYQPPPPPEWCFDREPRLLGSLSSDEIADLAQRPIRTVEEQLAWLRDNP